VTVELRDVRDDDLETFFAHQREPGAAQMAAMPSRDRDPFLAHWTRIRADPSNILRTVLADGAVAGNIVSWEQDGQRCVGYWIGQEHWGRGVATAALKQFVDLLPTGPVHAHVATTNTGSIRVLSKCGFRPVGAPVPADDGVEEFLYVLH
jgi:RimJ/RimL family protein N-acetyltransferase